MTSDWESGCWCSRRHSVYGDEWHFCPPIKALSSDKKWHSRHLRISYHLYPQPSKQLKDTCDPYRSLHNYLAFGLLRSRSSESKTSPWWSSGHGATPSWIPCFSIFLSRITQDQIQFKPMCVFHKPDVGVGVDPSFLVKKGSGGFCLMTTFSEVARYCKPQSYLLPNVDSTFRKIGQ